jgi:hypothetical protein
LDYTTTVSVAQTAGECQAVPGSAGAASVAVHYEDGQPAGLSFTLATPHGARAFTLPVITAGIRQVLLDAERDGQLAVPRKKQGSRASPQHAARVAWRVTRDWLAASLALTAAGMAQMEEVMLPYLHVDGDRTLWLSYWDREQAASKEGNPGA